jgi:hypothetical protein
MLGLGGVGCSSSGSPPTSGGSGPVVDAATWDAQGSVSPDAALTDAGTSARDGAVADGGADALPPDGAALVEAGPDACDLGSVGSFATDTSLDVFGQVVYYADGGALPSGQYRVSYVDGCMMYSSSGQGWTVNAYQGSPDSWWLVGATTADRIVVPPGTVGWQVDAGAFENFDDCVAASKLAAPVDFQFDGGPIGVWLQDSPYSDNVAGENGRNPKWDLTLLGGDCTALPPR